MANCCNPFFGIVTSRTPALEIRRRPIPDQGEFIVVTSLLLFLAVPCHRAAAINGVYPVRDVKPRVVCSGGAVLKHILTLRSHTRARLIPGIVWTGPRQIVAEDSLSRLVRWNFSGKVVQNVSKPVHTSPGGITLGLFKSLGGAVSASLVSNGPNRNTALKLDILSAQALSAGSRISGRELRSVSVPDYGLEGKLNFFSLVVPPRAAWLATIPAGPAAPGSRIRLWRFGTGKPLRWSVRLLEPENRGFATDDGSYLAWVSFGHWVRMLRVRGPGHGFTKVHVIGPDLQYGAFSPDGRIMVLEAGGTSSILGGKVQLISLRSDSPARERVLGLWGRAYRAVPVCPPAFSQNGKLLVAATLRLGSKWPVGIWVISGRSFTTLCYLGIRNDLPERIAFSTGRSELAVQCWYHVFVFRLPKRFPSRSQRIFHEPKWFNMWTSPKTIMFPPQRTAAQSNAK